MNTIIVVNIQLNGLLKKLKGQYIEKVQSNILLFLMVFQGDPKKKKKHRMPPMIE